MQTNKHRTKVLHLWANTRRIIQGSKYISNTEFHLLDLWLVDLSQADVVAIYGLYPFMKDLGMKMSREMKDGSIVVSNVFPIPGWKASVNSMGNVYVYSIPHCFPDDIRKMRLSSC